MRQKDKVIEINMGYMTLSKNKTKMKSLHTYTLAKLELDMMANNCDPSTWDTEIGVS